MKKADSPCMALVALFSCGLPSRVPFGLFKLLEEGKRTKGGIALSGMLTQPRGFCSPTTLMFYYRGIHPPRIRRPLLPPSFLHPFPVVFGGRPVRCCTCKQMASESKESTSLVRPFPTIF